MAFFHSDETETKRGKKAVRRCYFGRLAPVLALLDSTPSSGKNIHRGGDYAKGALRQDRNCVFPPRTFSCKRKQSDFREPTKRSRRFCGGAVGTFGETNRSGRNICTMCYFGRLAMDICPRELAWQAGKNRSWRTKWTTRQVGSVALVIHPAESTDHTE